jgi:hypothetical protein
VHKGRETLVLYLVAAAIYIAIGVAYVDFLLASVVALGYLLAVVWILPALVRRFLR